MTTINPIKQSNRIFTKRLFLYFIISLLMQSVVAYGALNIFISLPYSITGLPDDRVAERRSHQGTVYLIREHIKAHPELTVNQVLDDLEPQFGFRLQLFPTNTAFSSMTKRDLDKYTIAYDGETDTIYATLASGQILGLGPIDDNDLLDGNLLSFFSYLLLFAGFSAMTFCILLYFTFSYLWIDVKNMSITVNELGKGNLKVRAKPAQSWLFKQLAVVLNTMCDHIEKLVSSNRIILHAMAHELRTPLARMNFEIEMLSNTDDEPEKYRLIKEINNDIKELEVLINTSLNYFKIQQTQLLKNVTTVPLKTWAMTVINNLELFKPKNFELDYQIDDEIVTLDPLLVETVLKNLLLNSFKYAASKVTIRLYKNSDLLFIVIDDDGPGIPPDFREKVFLPFSRLDTSRTKSTGGYGLGLAYVKLIAEYCQGKAFVMTSPLGGARFVITLNFS
ncbi:two-component system sensor histidine kinase RstB/two-component system sensor kinase ParS [Orbus hercynius]|uniref:histidine kinase n=1 Tax=Orbus hercynius TaxID=593135 RepID=A0A495RFM7_9GAMM|nr:ATP-binding protein [Orbus hercynius]RKS86080.1 two-component system sensor histidine kinase RstB/two-component system sensor kinase ParS [Orbus hercynius]